MLLRFIPAAFLWVILAGIAYFIYFFKSEELVKTAIEWMGQPGVPTLYGFIFTIGVALTAVIWRNELSAWVRGKRLKPASVTIDIPTLNPELGAAVEDVVETAWDLMKCRQELNRWNELWPNVVHVESVNAVEKAEEEYSASTKRLRIPALSVITPARMVLEDFLGYLDKRIAAESETTHCGEAIYRELWASAERLREEIIRIQDSKR